MTDGHAFEYLRYTGRDTRRGPVDPDAALGAIGLCVAHAGLLLESAERIREVSASCVGLAVLALEELAKIDMLLLTATINIDDDRQWQRFWRAFSDHKPKLRNAVAWSVDQGAREAVRAAKAKDFTEEEFANTLNRLKQAAWYVDCIDGQFIGPAQQFGREEASVVLAMAHKQVTAAASQMDNYAASFADLLEFAKGAKTVGDLWQAQVAMARKRNSALESALLERNASASQEQLAEGVFD